MRGVSVRLTIGRIGIAAGLFGAGADVGVAAGVDVGAGVDTGVGTGAGPARPGCGFHFVSCEHKGAMPPALCISGSINL